MPSRLARVENWVIAPITGLAMVSGTGLQEVALQRRPAAWEHREGPEHRQHHRDQRHERDHRGEGEAAGGEREAVLAKARGSASRRCVTTARPAKRSDAARRAGVRIGHGAGGEGHCWHHKRRWTTAAAPTRRPASDARAGASASTLALIAARPGLGALARADRPRHARDQGAAARCCRWPGLAAHAPLHLSLDQPPGLALRRRRRGARDQRARHRRLAGRLEIAARVRALRRLRAARARPPARRRRGRAAQRRR